MNNKVLKNPLRQEIETVFRGRRKIIKSKASAVFDLDDEEELALYRHWLETYQFLYDITANLGGDIK